MGNQLSSTYLTPTEIELSSPRAISLKEADHYRYLAREETRFKTECEDEASQAKERGFEASAIEMTRQSQVHEKRRKLYNEEAAKIAYNANNNFFTKPDILFLHGLTTDESLVRIRERLFLLATTTSHPRPHDLTICTGLPHLDTSLLSEIQPTVHQMIQEHQLDVEYDRPEEGCIYVRLSWEDEDGVVHGGVYDAVPLYDAVPVHTARRIDDEDETVDGETVVDEDEFPRQGTPMDARLRKEGYEGPGPSYRARQEYRDAVRARDAPESIGWAGVAGGVVAAVGAVALAGFAIYKGTSSGSGNRRD